jgi:hypothetical protein
VRRYKGSFMNLLEIYCVVPYLGTGLGTPPPTGDHQPGGDSQEGLL